MDPRAARIQAIGILLYGETGWQSRLARAVGWSTSHMGAVLSGERRASDVAMEQVTRRLSDEIIPRLMATEAELRVHVSEMAAELGMDLDRSMTMEG